MSREITDTNKKFMNYDIKDGQHVFKILEVRKQYGKKGGEFFIWKLEYGDEGLVGEQGFLPNMLGELLKTLNCTETEPGTYDWDTEEQVGKSFSATVSHKPDEKNPTVMRQRMSGFLPF